MEATTEKPAFTIPSLNEGEKYAFGITLPDGKTIHTILLPGEEIMNWKDAMEWAKSLGGDLPDRAEQALFLKYMSEEFLPEWYWSNTQHAGNSYYAWCQVFDYGGQYYLSKSCECRVRPVRRVII
jgi:hypothetical protein